MKIFVVVLAVLERLFVFAVVLYLAIALRDIADAQIALASEGCYEVPERSYAVR